MSVAAVSPRMIADPEGLVIVPDDFRWGDLPAAGWIGDELAAMPVQDVSMDELLGAAEAWEKLSAWVAGNQARVLAEFDARRDAELEAENIPAEFLAAALEADEAAQEISLALHIAPGTARARVLFARDLVDRLPATVQGMCSGAVSWAKARVLADQSAELTREQTAVLEKKLLPWGAGKTPGQLRDKARREVLRIDPDAAHRRALKARRKRNVELIPRENGMADLNIHLPGTDAVAVYNWLDEIARAAKSGGEQRTLDQLRADALMDLVLQRSTAVARRPLVRVLVPAGTLAGGDTPGEMDGYGPIDADLARQLAADGTWQRLLTDPATGAVTDIDPTRYTPPAVLKAYVQARDRTCRFPTCNQPAHRTDIDHTIPFNNGTKPGTKANPGTIASNLGALCRRHHRLKDRPGTKWKLHQTDNGKFHWTTPEGHTYTPDPDPPAEPRPAPEPPIDEEPPPF